MAVPLVQRTQEACYKNFKFFAGPAARDPPVVVKTHAASELVGAVADLGWHPEPSLANRWPTTQYMSVGI